MPNKLNRLSILCLILFLLIPVVSRAATYYVDRNHPSANDTNPGTEDLPWLTIQHASETMVAGDSVLIKDGVYNEHVNTENSGTASSHIVFSAYPGDTPIIDGTGVSESQNGIIVDQSYIKLLGFEIRNWNDNGIWMANAGYVEISDCEVHDVTFGIGAAYGTHDFELNRVEVHHFDLYGFDASPSGGTDCYNGTINDCIAHSGRDPVQNVDGFALGHGTQHDFVFNRCETYDVYDGFDISSRNTTLNRCAAHDTWNGGYKIWADSVALVNCIGYHNNVVNVELDWDGEPGTTTLRNCTFMDTQTFNVAVENSADHLEMYNCILAGGDNIGLLFAQMGVSNYSGDYNLFHNDNPARAISVGYEDEFSLSQIESGDWTTYSGQDANSLVAYTDTAIFLEPVTHDLHLIGGSPAVDHGTSNGAPSEDFEGNPRPVGAGYDIGAYEYQVEGIETDTGFGEGIPRGFMLAQNYPNPFNGGTVVQYSLSESGAVEIDVYNILGQRVRTLIRKVQSAGIHHVSWDGRDDSGREVPSGIYLYRLRMEGISQVRKLLYMK
jgi:hypothetical protein